MPILQNVLLGVLFGYYMSFAQVESVWWPHLTASPESLKSKVPATTRGNALSFYKSSLNSPYNLDYFLLATVGLLLLSFAGGVIQKPKFRIVHGLSFLLIAIGAGVEILQARPLIQVLVAKPGKLVETLFNIAFYRAIVFGSIFATVFIQVGAEVDEEEKVKTE